MKHGPKLGASLCLWVGIRLLAVPPAAADPPAIEHLFPAGLARPSTNHVMIAGKLEPWPPRAWVNCPGVTITSETNKGRLQIAVAADAPTGPHLFRLFNDDGASVPRILVISDAPQTLEQEPNDYYTSPQQVASLPSTINGRLDKVGDVDSFAIRLEAGQWLDARLDAYTLASRVDPLLRLLTPDGLQLTWNHDFGSLDSRLIWKTPASGAYVVQVMGFKHPADSEVRFTGGDGCVYRLHLDASGHRPELTRCATPEHEPNNTVTNAMRVTLPASIRGTIGCEGDEDWFAVELAKDASMELQVAAGSLGSPLDVWARLVGASGKELARTDDPGRFGNPRLEWKSTTNATVYAVVANFVHRGGPDYEYRADFRLVAPEYQAFASSDAITIEAGSTNEVKLTVNRLRGFDHRLTVSLDPLPAGVRAEPASVSEKGGETILKLVADADAKPAQLPARLVVADTTTNEQTPVPFRLTNSTEDNGVPGGYTKLLVETTDWLWLTVKPRPPQK